MDQISNFLEKMIELLEIQNALINEIFIVEVGEDGEDGSES